MDVSLLRLNVQPAGALELLLAVETADASAISTARRSSSAPAGWTFRRSRDTSSSGCETSFDAKAVRSSFRRPMVVSTRTSCVNCPAVQTSPARSWPSNTRALMYVAERA